jgi:hypothetical protein
MNKTYPCWDCDAILTEGVTHFCPDDQHDQCPNCGGYCDGDCAWHDHDQDQRPTLNMLVTDYEAVTILVALRHFAKHEIVDYDEKAHTHINALVDQIKSCARRSGLTNVL